MCQISLAWIEGRFKGRGCWGEGLPHQTYRGGPPTGPQLSLYRGTVTGPGTRSIISKLPLLPAAVVNTTRASVWRYRLRRIHTRHRAANPEEYVPLEKGIRAYRDRGGLVHDGYGYSLLALWRLLERHRPSSILELGSGGSTGVFARYCATYGARLVTLDEDPRWLDVTKEIVEDEHPTADVHFRLAARVVRQDGTEPNEFRYDAVLQPEFDLVLVDGPSLFHEGKHFHWAANTNVFDVVQGNKPEVILVDMRPGTVDEINRRLGDAYSCQPSDLIRRRLKADYNYFTVFQRRRP